MIDSHDVLGIMCCRKKRTTNHTDHQNELVLDLFNGTVIDKMKRIIVNLAQTRQTPPPLTSLYATKLFDPFSYLLMIYTL
jgi:hypothetical protein